MSAEISADKLAQQFGLATNGVALWSVVIVNIAKPDVITHQRKPEHGAAPFVVASPVVREPPLLVIEELAQKYGTALAAACISQLNEAAYIAWSDQARPLLALQKEVSFLSMFPTFVRSDVQGRKLYNGLLRGILRLMGDGSWVDSLGVIIELDESVKYTNIGVVVQLDVLESLLVSLPILLNTIAALDVIPTQHAKSAAYTRTQLQNNIDKLAGLDGARPGMLWNADGQGTGIGNQVAYVYNGLVKVRETLRA